MLLEDGGVAVANRASHEIFFYDRRGRFQAIVGGMGEGPAELRAIDHLGPHPDGVFITDGASTVLVYDRRHRLVQDLRLGDLAAEGLRFWPVGAFPDGSLVGSLRGHRGDHSSRSLGEKWISYEDAVRVDTEGRIVARLTGGGQFEQVLEEVPRAGARPGGVTFGAHGGIVLTRGDHAYRGVMSDYSIELYDSTFALRAIFRLDQEPRRVTRQDIEDYIQWTADAWGASATEQVSPELLRFLRDHRYGGTYPAWGAPWILDDTGHLWVPEFAWEIRSNWRVYDEAGSRIDDR